MNCPFRVGRAEPASRQHRLASCDAGSVEDTPSGTATFLFTDIEDSSRLWDLHPIQMRRRLERHDELMTSAIVGNSSR